MVPYYYSIGRYLCTRPLPLVMPAFLIMNQAWITFISLGLFYKERKRVITAARFGLQGAKVMGLSWQLHTDSLPARGKRKMD
mmetsp:Transcript_29057/g.56920  ORF Transcript_29057/g.56920 Transcript_29057/m.56920 type:complete len:82 (-) Transcript_29057:483-728(-)